VGTAVLVVATAASCTSADGEVRGGEARFDAALPQPFDAGVTEEADTEASPTSWRGIYRDMFGRSAVSGCAGGGTCHDALGRQGTSVSQFVCGTVDDCYDSMRNKGADPKTLSGLVKDEDVASPDDARLFKVLRIRQADGTVANNLDMPLQPRDFAFTQEQVERMKTWIRNGAKKD